MLCDECEFMWIDANVHPCPVCESNRLRVRVKELEDKLYNYCKNLAGSKADLDYECLQILKKRDTMTGVDDGRDK